MINLKASPKGEGFSPFPEGDIKKALVLIHFGFSILDFRL